MQSGVGVSGSEHNVRIENRLARETSPYLQQHATNPVDWYPWGAEALQQARASGKPILLSIGYSACHWCHVMAHESFENPATAAVMNELFVNVKVDREERPDLDKIYQIAHQMLTQRGGGWPLTMFLTPDQTPFFGGTYFPNEPRQGMPAFTDLIGKVAEFYQQRGQEVSEQNAALLHAFDQLVPAATEANAALNDAPLRAARAELESTFDKQFGGFGSAPKFPHPVTLERLLRDWHATAQSNEPDLQALYMSTLTLKRMADGGLFDQLAGGFARYSVDAWWMIPHFEKMLYDNGALLACYAQAAIATGDDFFAQIARETGDWVLRDMQSPAGGYYSSFDADSEGHEGKYYVWQREEVAAVLTEDEYAVFAPRFGIDREPNFEGKDWHLHCFRSLEQVAAEEGLNVESAVELIDSARRKLLTARQQRIAPARDEKILVSWNALMIRGLAQAARATGRREFTDSASRALQFIRREMWRDGRLLATSKDGHSHLAAYLDDYVLLADAVLELQQQRFQADELQFAVELIEVVLRQFQDTGRGGFFFTADDHEALIHRPKGFGDDATPAGNGVAAQVLQRLGYLLGEPRYLQAAERTLRAGWQPLERYAQGHMSMLTALEEYLHAPEIIILRGEPAQIEHWQCELQRLYAPQRMVLAIPAGAALPAALAAKTARGAAAAYICRGSVCSAPVDSLASLLRMLRLDHQGVGSSVT